MIASELDPEFDRMCEEIKESRRKRGELPSYITNSSDCAVSDDNFLSKYLAVARILLKLFHPAVHQDKSTFVTK